MSLQHSHFLFKKVLDIQDTKIFIFHNVFEGAIANN